MRAVSRELLVFLALISTIAVLGVLAVERVAPARDAGANVTEDEGVRRRVVLTIGGVGLGSPQGAAPSGSAITAPPTPQAVAPSAASVEAPAPPPRITWSLNRVATVDGLMLEVNGNPVLRAGQALEEATRVLGPPSHQGWYKGKRYAPAVRYRRHNLTVMMIPGTTIMGGFRLCGADEVQGTITRSLR